MAADRISRSGHEVVVLEARDRVGGRVWSQELVPGDPRTAVERGAEFVLDGYDLMRAVADVTGDGAVPGDAVIIAVPMAALGVAGGPARWASRVAALRPELAADLDRAMLTTWNAHAVS